MIRDFKGARAQVINKLGAKYRLCLTGTPLQNHVKDLYSLIRFLRISPWNVEEVWQNCIENLISMNEPRAQRSLQRLMEAVTLRRLKSTLLQLPEKQQEGVILQLHEPWHTDHARRYENFLMVCGKNRDRSLGWDSAIFFQELSDLRQVCNHPALIEHGNQQYHWNASSQVRRLIEDLRRFLSGGEGDFGEPKVVVFSEYHRFLEM